MGPPFRADHVGSLLRPAAVKEARAQRERGEIDAAALKAVEDREIVKIIRKQEEIGLEAVTDGEFRRAFWQIDFLENLDGVESYQGERKVKFQGPQPKPILLRVKDKLGSFSGHPMLEHFRFVKEHARAVPKMTIPSPSSLHFRYGRQAVPKHIYPSMDDFYRDLGESYRKAVRAFADAGCRYLQLDEVNLAYLCDPTLRQQVKERGDDPATLPMVYADLHASLPRQFPIDLRGQRRLPAGRRDPVQRDQGARLFHGIRQRPRRRLRAAALRAQGQARGARPRHLEERPAGEPRRDPAANRRGCQVHPDRPALPEPAMRLCLDRGGQYP
jgi:Cobalamin-independent synthase, Catalytic domain